MRAWVAVAVGVALSCGVASSEPTLGPRKPAAKEERAPAKEGAATRPGLKGHSGNVEWEVIDAIQTHLDAETARWDFVVVLRMTGWGEIRLTQIETGTGRAVGSQRPTNAVLRPGDGLRMVHTERASRGDDRREIFRRYLGRDDKGDAVAIEVRIRLEPSFGARRPVPAARIEAPPGDAALPPDLRVVPPDSGVPAQWAAFSGVWSGQYEGGRTHVLVVEEVGVRDATVAYGVGPVRDRPAAWLRLRAQSRADQLVIFMAYNETAVYTRGPDGALAVTWTSEDGRSARGRLTRYTVAARRPSDDKPVGRAGQLASDALAALYDGQYADALPKAQEALAIREASLGASHPDVAVSLTTLAEVHRAQGRLDEAERLHRRALTIREGQLGKEHPEVAASLNHLAVIQNARGKYKDAESLLRRALAMVDKSPASASRANRVKVDVLETLAKVYRAQGRTREAEETQARATMLWATQ
jgi:hypothetical protein